MERYSLFPRWIAGAAASPSPPLHEAPPCPQANDEYRNIFTGRLICSWGFGLGIGHERTPSPPGRI